MWYTVTCIRYWMLGMIWLVWNNWKKMLMRLLWWKLGVPWDQWVQCQVQMAWFTWNIGEINVCIFMYICLYSALVMKGRSYTNLSSVGKGSASEFPFWIPWVHHQNSFHYCCNLAFPIFFQKNPLTVLIRWDNCIMSSWPTWPTGRIRTG